MFTCKQRQVDVAVDHGQFLACQLFKVMRRVRSGACHEHQRCCQVRATEVDQLFPVWALCQRSDNIEPAGVELGNHLVDRRSTACVKAQAGSLADLVQYINRQSPGLTIFIDEGEGQVVFVEQDFQLAMLGQPFLFFNTELDRVAPRNTDTACLPALDNGDAFAGGNGFKRLVDHAFKLRV
ncbi:hypothetical protein D3C78_922140 [compost metagenome]